VDMKEGVSDIGLTVDDCLIGGVIVVGVAVTKGL
jgi:hypothetical protein